MRDRAPVVVPAAVTAVGTSWPEPALEQGAPAAAVFETIFGENWVAALAVVTRPVAARPRPRQLLLLLE